MAPAPEVGEIGGRADVEGEHVVGDRGPVAADHLALGEIEADRFVVNQRRPGETRERAQIHVHIVEIVMAGDEAGQHAGIRRMHVAGDEGDAHARHRRHAETLEHGDVGVPAADQHQVLDDGRSFGRAHGRQVRPIMMFARKAGRAASRSYHVATAGKFSRSIGSVNHR